jgi:hypothetical protein
MSWRQARVGIWAAFMIMARNGLYMTISGHDDGSPVVAAQTPPGLAAGPACR